MRLRTGVDHPRVANKGACARTLFVLFALLALPAMANNKTNQWSWTIYPDLYKTMDQFQRAEYDAASKLTADEDRRYHGHRDPKVYGRASVLWRKFRVLYEEQLDEAVTAHIIFMEAYTLHKSKERYKAIKTYTEVLDYFPDELWVAAPALYFRGRSHLDNGDTRKGMEDMKALYDDPDYREHPLAAGAIRLLADNSWDNGKIADAIKYYKDVDRIFSTVNKAESGIARDNVIDYLIREQKYAELINWRLADDKRNDAKARVSLADWAWHRAYHNFHRGWRKYRDANDPRRLVDKKAFNAWFQQQRTFYQQDDQPWNYLTKLLTWTCRQHPDNKLRDKTFEEAMQLAKKTELTDEERDKRYAALSDSLRDLHQFALARETLTYMKNRNTALWREEHIVGHRMGRWADAIPILDQIAALDPKKTDRRVLWEKGTIYEQRLGKYEEALKIFRSLAEPPKTLWHIQSCYRKMGKADAAINTLKELSSMFPDQAAKATFTQAEYHRLDARDKQAIALYRRILAHPDWTQTPEASTSHQRLEDYNVKTGGGVIHED